MRQSRYSKQGGDVFNVANTDNANVTNTNNITTNVDHAVMNPSTLSNKQFRGGYKVFIISILYLLFAISNLQAQYAPLPAATASAGGSATFATDQRHPGEYSYTVGQSIFGVYGDDNVATIEEGVQHVFCLPTDDTAALQMAAPSFHWAEQDLCTSGFYSKTYLSTDGCDSTVNLHLAILTDAPLPHIYAYRDRLLAVDHNSDGFVEATYRHYRWYRDGVLVREGSSYDSYQQDGEPLTGCYQLQVAADSALEYWVESNTVCFGSASVQRAATVDFSLLPNPVRHGATVRLTVALNESELQDAHYLLYDVHGREMMSLEAHTLTSFQANLAAGVYMVYLHLADGRHGVRKLLVR